MSPRTRNMLIGLLVVLAAWVLIVERPFTDYVRGPERRAAPLLPDLDPAAVTAIEIRTPAKTTRLAKAAGSWVVASEGGFAADQKAVGDLLASLDTLTTGITASMNPDNRSTFGVDSTGVEVRIEAGSDRVGHLRVGTSTPDFSGLFIRREGEDPVYAISGITRFQFDRGAQTWRDRKIVPWDAELVRSVHAAWGDTAVTVTRLGADSLDAASWTVSGSLPGQEAVPAKSAPARLLATSAAGLTADAFPAEGDSIPADWGTPVLRVEVEVQGGDRAVVEFGPKNERGQHYVRRAGSPAVYLIGTWRADRLRQSYDALAEPASGEAGASG